MPAIQQRRGTAADLALANETPLAGQIYFETDTNKVKIGDGSRTYNALPYLSDSTSIADLDGLQASLDANAAAAAAAQATADSKATVASVTAVDNHVSTLDAAFAQHKSRHAITGTDPLSPADIGAAPDTVVSRVTTNEGDILFAKLDITNLISITSGHSTDIATLQSDVSGITPASIGAQPAGTYATLVNGTVPSSQLPSYVDDVIEASAVASFPATGDTGKIYVDTGTNKTYRWSGSTYIEIASSPGSTDAVPEGSVNLYYTDARAQAALAGALSTKVDTTDARLTDARTPLAHTHALADLQQSGASTNDVIAWSGTAWVPTTGGGSGGSTTLGGLNDVNISSASTGQHLRYVNLTQSWVNSAIPLGDLDGTGVSLGQFARFFNGSWGASTLYLSHIADVSSILPTNGQVLTYNSAQSVWEAQTPAQTTDDLAEGSTNLYYTDTRAEAAARGIVGTTVNTLCAGDDARLSDARTPLAHTHAQSDITNLVTDLSNKADLVAGKVPSSQLPAYVDDVLEYANAASFPATGETGKIYVDLSDGRIYRWSGSSYVVISASPGTTDDVPEGSTNLYHTAARAETAALGIVGTAANTLCAGDDSRLSDARTPLAHTHAQSEVTNLVTDLSNKVDTNDARLSDARTPLAHTHPQSDITNLVTDLAGKASTNHSHDLDTLSDYTLDSNAGEGPVIRKGGGNGFFFTNVGYGTFAGNINIQDLNNVSVSSAATGDVLAWNGTGWANSPGVASNTTQAGGGTAVNNIVVISQAAYTALGTKDANTLYFIT